MHDGIMNRLVPELRANNIFKMHEDGMLVVIACNTQAKTMPQTSCNPAFRPSAGKIRQNGPAMH
eukprot:11170117-Lingulodinium_polyedra.AAC.1